MAHIVAAAAVALLPACHPYVEGNGVFFEEDRTSQLGAFTGLRVADGIQGTVTVGSPQRVVVSGDSNIVQHISTVVLPLPDGTLVLDVSVKLETYTSTSPLRAVVTVPAVRYLSATKASRIEASGATTPPGTTFRVAASDGSDVSLAGPGGETLDVELSGGSHGGAQLDARSYPVSPAATAHTNVALSGSSRALIKSDGAVSGEAEAGSTVENYGTGACGVTVSGKAEIVPNQCKPP